MTKEAIGMPEKTNHTKENQAHIGQQLHDGRYECCVRVEGFNIGVDQYSKNLADLFGDNK